MNSVFLPSFLIGVLIALPTGPIGILIMNQTLHKNYRAAASAALGPIVVDGVLAALAVFNINILNRYIQHYEEPILFIGGLVMLLVGTGMLLQPYKHDDIATLRQHAGNFSKTLVLGLSNPASAITFPFMFALISTGAAYTVSDKFVGLAGFILGTIVCWALFIWSPATSNTDK